MATSKLFGGTKPATASGVVPTPPTKLTDKQFETFANWIPSGDTRAMSADLLKRGLIGADSMVDRAGQVASNGAPQANESAWKTAAIAKMLMQARRVGMKTPLEINTNKEYLLSGLESKYKDAIKSEQFNKQHPNFWNVFSGIYQDQLAKENQPPLPVGVLAAK